MVLSGRSFYLMDKSGLVDNRAAMPALAWWVSVGKLGRALVVVCTWMCVCVYVYARIRATRRRARAHQHAWVRLVHGDGLGMGRDGGGGAG